MPILAKYREHALKATSRTPKVCSDMAAAGISLGTSLDIEKIKILGLYPVYQEISKFSMDNHSMATDSVRTSPTASHFPSGLKDKQVAAFIRSRADHVLVLGESS